MDFSEIQKMVGSIRKSLFKGLKHHNAGPLKPGLRGPGMQFKDYQLYVHGDDVRFIDWKILARTQTPYIKVFEQEKNLDIRVIVDLSPSMEMGWGEISKIQVALDILYLLFFHSQKTKDRIEVVLLGSTATILPHATGIQGLVSLLHCLKSLHLINAQGQWRPGSGNPSTMGANEKNQILSSLPLQKKEILILSDFVDLVPFSALPPLVQNRNIYPVWIFGPLDREQVLPFSVHGFSGHATSSLTNRKGLTFRTNREEEPYREWLEKQKKVLKLKIEGPYLHQFIKEMSLSVSLGKSL